MEVVMQSFIHDANIALYTKLLTESARDISLTNQPRHKMLLQLLAEEKAKGRAPPAEYSLSHNWSGAAQD